MKFFNSPSFTIRVQGQDYLSKELRLIILVDIIAISLNVDCTAQIEIDLTTHKRTPSFWTTDFLDGNPVLY
ncbi:hypothetical protein cauri_0057 [Corynebacterium aurimucosum ATCC 700975]|uniref:Uncharacterized protein n=1 Tax=Corynebacterium aurimucosum (strain ATCC 700975 / DSM 44827 / CIP 107346 / CN-1) TaxID=548476 RepID=C3PIZ8_CORA7|nr:hypothetical protein cauri_0057 [Corynebacterium aurimucosum ATCC 700975]